MMAETKATLYIEELRSHEGAFHAVPVWLIGLWGTYGLDIKGNTTEMRTLWSQSIRWWAAVHEPEEHPQLIADSEYGALQQAAKVVLG